MTKKLALSLGLVFIIAVGGVGVWKAASRQGPGGACSPTETGEYRELASRLERVQGELKRAQAERDALAGRSPGGGVKGPGRRESPPKEPSKEEKPAGTAGGSGINWSDLASLLSKDVDILSRRHDPAGLTEEEEAQRKWLYAELEKISATAKSHSPHPFFDRQFFDELTRAFFADSVHMTGDQLARLDRLNDAIFADVPEDIDALSSIDRYRLRQDLFARFSKGMEGFLTDDQMKDWATVHEFAEEMLVDGRSMEIGPAHGSKSLLNLWYPNASLGSLSPDLLDSLTPVADSYIQEASAVNDRYLPGGADPKDLSAQDRLEWEKQLLELQGRFQDQVGPFLDEEGRKTLHDKPPLIIRIVPGRGGSVSISGAQSLF